MSITSVSNRWLNRLYKTIAILLVMVAVLLSAFRLLLPYVGNYRADLQDYINENNQTQVSIGSLSMTWQRFGPVLIVNNVNLIDTEQAFVFIERIESKIDFWGSLTQQRLVSSNLVIKGANVKVDQGLWSNHAAEQSNTPSQETNEDADSFTMVTNIFLNRLNKFSIHDSDIVVHNESLERDIHINNLQWLNTDDLHQAQGSIVINELSSNNVQLSLNLIGENSADLSGQIYVEANNLDITPWLDSVLAVENDNTKSDISFAVWLNVRNSAVERLQVKLNENNIQWLINQKQQKLSLGEGQLLLVKGKKAKSFRMFSTPLMLQFNEQPKQEFTVSMNKLNDMFSAYVSSVDLSLLGQIGPLITEDQGTRDLFSQLSLSGQVTDIYLASQSDDLQIVADFSSLSNQFSHGIPALENLYGNVSYAGKELFININGQEGALDFAQHFVAPISYQTLAAKLNVSFMETGWRLAVNSLDFASSELKLSAQVEVDSPNDGETTMALMADIQQGNAALAGHYYPLSLMSDSLVGYLNSAIVEGTIEQAQVLVNGPLSHFPFSDGSGIFVVDAELTDSTFKFASDWPEISDFSANLNFTNNSMMITGRKGLLSGLDVTGVRAGIDELSGEQLLKVDAKIKPSNADYIANLMDQSPLKNTVGATLEQLQISGDVSGDFSLKLPLQDVSQSVASGVINFADNQLALQTPRMDFNQVKGQLFFENEVITTNGLSLLWQGLPINLDVKGQNKDDYYDTDIVMQAIWQEDDYQQHVPDLLKKYSAGQLPWSGTLSLHQHHQEGFSYNLAISSDLAGSILHLPTPYGKKAEQENSFSVTANGQMARSTINAQLGEEMSFYGVLNHKETRFSRAHLVLGNEKMLLPMNGFHITTKLDQAKFSHWQPLISDIIDSVSEASEPNHNDAQNTTSPLFAVPERIRGTIGELTVLGQTLNNVSFNLFDKEDWWLLQLNAKETRSQLKFYPHWYEQGVDINAEFVHLTPKINEQSEQDTLGEESEATVSDIITNDIVFNNIPKMSFRCDRCQIGRLNLGEVSFSVERAHDDLIKFNNFIAKRDKTVLAFSGNWRHNQQESITQFSGDLEVDSIENELNQLGYESIIRDSGGVLDFNLNWNGGPHDFEIAKSNGQFSADIDDGYLADVSDKARIFSVLSLQSLVRKLTLDFRDIFSDGMFYSAIEGEYQLKKGVLYTDSTEMNGTAGDLYMTGNTNLATGILDYKMSYKPNLTSSLPVLAWIATLNPVTFLAGVAIDQVIKSQVVSEFTFELTGNVSDPSFREVDRKSKDVSVGRKTPPEIVDSPVKPDKNNKSEEPDKRMRQYKQPDSQNELPEKIKDDS